MSNRLIFTSIAAIACVASGAAQAKTLKVSITNEQASTGVYITPLFTAIHDGTFDPFDAGQPASAAVEALAEEGDPSMLATPGLNAQVITSPGGFAPLPIVDPGETASVKFTVNPLQDTYLSFMAMIIPSNDVFIGNDDPLAYQIFSGGSFTGLGPIEVFAGDAWDAGTEVNDGMGAPFNTTGGASTPEMGVITQVANLDFLLNQPRAVGGNVTTGTSAGSLLATINVAAVPLPAGMPLMLAAFGAFGALRMRKRPS